MPARLLVRLPAPVDPLAAAFAEPLAVALHAVRRLAPGPGEPVLIAGCGPIGGLAALLLSRRHDGPVLVAERNAARRDRVVAVTGACPTDIEPAAIAGKLAGAPLLNALDATGSPAVIARLLDLVAPGGRLGLVGIGDGTVPVDPSAAWYLRTHVMGTADELGAALIRERDEQACSLRQSIVRSHRLTATALGICFHDHLYPIR